MADTITPHLYRDCDTMITTLPDNDSRAIHTILANLSFFNKPGTIASKLLAANPRGLGKFRLLCSRAVNAYALKSFEYAPMWPADDYDPIDEVTLIVGEHLDRDATACVVSQHGSGPAALAELQAWSWSPMPWHFAVHASDVETVYYFVTHDDAKNTTRIRDISNIKGAFGLMFLSGSHALRSGMAASSGSLDEIVANTTEVIVPAFDGQGLLLWKPGQSEEKVHRGFLWVAP